MKQSKTQQEMEDNGCHPYSRNPFSFASMDKERHDSKGELFTSKDREEHHELSALNGRRTL